MTCEPSLIKIFAVSLKKVGALATLEGHSKDTAGQTGWMPRLIWHTGNLLVLSYSGSFNCKKGCDQ